MEVGQTIKLYGRITKIDHIDEVEELILVDPPVLDLNIGYPTDTFSFCVIEEAIKQFKIQEDEY